MTTFLHKLWDETLAGPTPDTGLGKLRKYDPVSASESPPVKISGDIPVTRSITILTRGNSGFRNFLDDRNGRMIDSGITSPRTPLTPGTPECDLKRFPWKRSSAESLEQDD
ncbi:dormancy-associated protein homolog 4-like [Benincasa hispida]|uniref:dormancy-associated protein homolog 4-like n=1 Tax=Benincasa hispida TaxID=102211 RepID=UPI0019013F75|nr:dormancy-associated protein homolog 4-like [Benincasa hispida]